MWPTSRPPVDSDPHNRNYNCACLLVRADRRTPRGLSPHPPRNKDTQACGGCFSAAAFLVAPRLVTALRRVEANQAANRATEAHHVAVDHLYFATLGLTLGFAWLHGTTSWLGEPLPAGRNRRAQTPPS